MLRQSLLLILVISLLLGNPELYPELLKTYLNKIMVTILILILTIRHPEIARIKNWPAIKEIWLEQTTRH